MRVYFLAVARDVLKALLGAVSTLAAVLARSDLLSLQIVGGLGQAAECRLTIRSSRRRFAARLNSGVRRLGKKQVNAASFFNALQTMAPWVAPLVALLALLLPWPRRFLRRSLLAVALGWGAFVAFTLLLYNPAGVAAGHSLGQHFPEVRYDNNTVGITLFFGWLPPALAVGLYALARQGWLRLHSRGA